jgi:transcriptional regulator
MLTDSPARRKRKMLKLRKLGIRDVDIAKTLGMSRQRVGQILGPSGRPNWRNGRA